MTSSWEKDNAAVNGQGEIVQGKLVETGFMMSDGGKDECIVMTMNEC